MPSGGSRKNRRAYRLRWFRLRWWREARALPRPSRSLQAWACGSRVAFDAQFGVNDFELRLDGHFSVEKARTWWPNHGKYLDNGRKLMLLYVFSPVIGDFPRGSVVTELFCKRVKIKRQHRQQETTPNLTTLRLIWRQHRQRAYYIRHLACKMATASCPKKLFQLLSTSKRNSGYNVVKSCPSCRQNKISFAYMNVCARRAQRPSLLGLCRAAGKGLL